MIIPMSSIKIEKRGRQDFGDIVELGESLQRLGLIEPIVVEDKQDGTYRLLAGERRIRAAALIGWKDIPAVTRENLTEEERVEIELEENIGRKDLHWAERVFLVKRLDDIKKQEHGVKSKVHKEGWSIEDTAMKLRKSAAAVSLDIKMARAIVADPQILKKYAHLPQAVVRKKLDMADKTKTLRIKVADGTIKITTDLRLGNCVDLAKKLKPASVHLWLTDPPFAKIPVEKVGSFGTYMATESNVSDGATMEKVYRSLIPTMYLKLCDGAHFYMFFAHKWYDLLTNLLSEAGFSVADDPIIWDKGRQTVPMKDAKYMMAYEAILYGFKPPLKRSLKKPMLNVLRFKAIDPDKRRHPLQRPENLLRTLITQSTDPGELVVDTFAGSGSTLAAARALKRRSVGFEIDEHNYLTALAWLSELDEQGKKVEGTIETGKKNGN